MLQIDLPFHPGTPREARHAVASRYAASPRCGDLLLCVSEVVTNAVLHARSAPRLTLTQHGDVVRVEVVDDDPHLPVRVGHGLSAPTGRGLHLLDRLTTAWGADARDGGKVVWFELDLVEGGA